MPPEPSSSSTVYPGTAGQFGSAPAEVARAGMNGPVSCGSWLASPDKPTGVGSTTSAGRLARSPAGTQARVGALSMAEAAPQTGQRASAGAASGAASMG